MNPPSRFWPAAALCLAAAGPALAQTPTITSAGDPSVDADSIYALSVEPAAYPKYAAIRLLDDGVVRIGEDGTSSRTYRTVLQVLKREAIEGWSEFTWTIDPERERFRLNWVRVLRPDGTVITDGPLHYQESDVPVGTGPVYTDMKEISFSISGVETGAIIDYSFTIDVIDPVLPGDVLLTWGITTGTPVRRSRYLLDAPADMELRIRAENLPAPVDVVEHDSRLTRRYVYAELEPVEVELFPADSAAPYSALLITGPVAWSGIAEWYAGLARDRYELGPDVAAVVDSITDAVPDRERIGALHRWIAQDIRYVSLSLGIGGYQPRTPDATYSSRAGDCKDKATLFVAAARRLGFEAYPVLVSSMGGVNTDHPSLSQFDHAIAAYREPGGTWRYADLTAGLIPHGELPVSLQGSYGLLVRDAGGSELVELPQTSVPENYKLARLEGELLPDGSFTGRYSEEGRGLPGHVMRETLPNPLDETRYVDVARAVAQGVLPGASGDSLHVFIGRDWSDAPSLALRIQSSGFVQDVGDGRYLLQLPLTNYAQSVMPLISQLEADTVRSFSIDATAVSGLSVVEQILEVTLPEGWTAELPPSIDVNGDFGGYRASYEQDGRVLRAIRRLSGARGVFGPDRIGDLSSWLAQVAQDDARFVLIDAGGA